MTADALKDARLVVLANCGRLQQPQYEMLRTFVAGGGGLLIFPGDRVNPKVYDDQFFPVPGPQGERLTAARLEAPEGDPDKTDTFQQLGKIDFGHPALSLFDSPDPEARPLTSFRVYKRFKIVMPEKKGNAWALAYFGNGSPALVESRLGRRRRDPIGVPGPHALDEPSDAARLRPAGNAVGQPSRATAAG